MRKVLISTSAMVLALAAPVPAEAKAEAPVSCATETTQILDGIQRSAEVPNPGPAYVGAAINSAPGFLDDFTNKVNVEMPAECKPHTRQNILAYTGKGSWSEPAPKPAVAQSAPQAAPTASAVETPKVQASRQEVAQLQTERSAAVQRVVVLKKVYAPNGFTAAERKALDDATTKVADIDNKIVVAETKLKKYVDEQIAGVRIEVDKKANASDVYTKAEVDALKGWSALKLWPFWLAILIGFAGIVFWVHRTRRSNQAADEKFATKTEIVTIEVRGTNFEDLQQQKDGDALPLEFLASNGKAFLWHFGRKDGKWFTPTGGTDHNPQHDLIADPAKTIQKWVRKGQITI